MASVPSFRTWVAGEIATAAFFNANVRDAGNFFLSLPVAELRQTIAQSIPNSVGTAINFDAEDVDTDNGHSTSVNTSRYTAQTQGRFQVSGGVSYASHADSNVRQVEIDQNGASVPGTDVAIAGFSADNARIPTRVKQIFMNVNDFVTIVAFQGSTVSLNTVISGVAQQPNMSVRWVGTS